jgi:hypothetical protein
MVKRCEVAHRETCGPIAADGSLYVRNESIERILLMILNVCGRENEK